MAAGNRRGRSSPKDPVFAAEMAALAEEHRRLFLERKPTGTFGPPGEKGDSTWSNNMRATGDATLANTERLRGTPHGVPARTRHVHDADCRLPDGRCRVLPGVHVR